jgi:FkbM family methyltransferase
MNLIGRLSKATLHRVPLTRLKLFIARILYGILHRILREDVHRIQRKDVSYEVDLSEGIDLSLYLFGNFQNYITSNKFFSVPKTAVILDIGANVGSMALRFAQLASQGHVYAFEPTRYAFAKLMRNLSLNPELARRITPVQVFVSDQASPNPRINAYSSWKVDGSAEKKHPLHGGAVKSAESVSATTVDEFCLKNRIQNVDLIKIDTDGHEFHVLRGARETLGQHRPHVIFEIGLYLLRERGITFDQYYDFLSSFGYRLYTSKTCREITRENFETRIPWRYAIDIVAIPPKRPALKDLHVA